MKIEITTNAKSVEMSNFLLAMAIDELEQKPELLFNLGLTKKDLEKAGKFRKQLASAFLKVSRTI